MTEQVTRGDRVEDLGWLVQINRTPGTSWVNFPGVALEVFGVEPMKEDAHRGAAPVPTDELLAAKGQDGPLSNGDFFWAEVNIGATTPEEVQASNFSYEPPLTDEQLAAFERRESE